MSDFEKWVELFLNQYGVKREKVYDSFSGLIVKYLEMLIDGAIACLKKWYKKKELGKNLIEHIMNGTVDEFLEEKLYDEVTVGKVLGSDLVYQIRKIGALRSLLVKVDFALKERKYSEEAAGNFIELAGIFEDISARIQFEVAGIKIKVPSPDSGEVILITDENYWVALLHKFAADIWTQVARKLTDKKGIASGYPSEIIVELEKPTPFLKTKHIEKSGGSIEMLYVEEPTLGQSLKFMDRLNDLFSHYTSGLKICESYRAAIQSLKSAKYKLELVKSNQEKHSFFEPSHLESLISIFKAESQYWLFHTSEDLTQLESTVNFVNNYKDIDALKKLAPNEKDWEVFKEFLRKYSRIIEYLSGTLELYNNADKNCTIPEDTDTIKDRIKELKNFASFPKAYLYGNEPEKS